MIEAAFNVGILTVLFFVLGMIKPKWPLFFMNSPDRMTIMVITMVGIMVSVTLFGEGSRQKKLLDETAATSAVQSEASAVPVPVEQ